MIKLYLDIDGVLLTAKHTRAADGVGEFVAFVTKYFDCYWLTTHCKGDSKPALKYLSQFMQPETIEQLRVAVKPTSWDTLKTEALDFESDFYWLDDSPFQAELACLQANGLAERLIIINLNHTNELLTIQSYLTQV
jgi:hypothetical protein